LRGRNGTTQIFPAACVSYVLRALGVRTLGDRMSKDAQDQLIAALSVLALIIVEVML
jgi:hypothetical protein